jgi:hypothetical protein
MVMIIIHTFYCGLAGYLIADVLSMKGQLLGWVRPQLFKLANVKDEFELTGFAYIFYMITIGCSKCIAGQLALWSSPFLMEELNVWWWSYGVTTAIFTPTMIKKMFN